MKSGVLVLAQSFDGVAPGNFVLSRPKTTIGRSMDSDIILNDKANSVSRRHAFVERRPEGHVLVDHGSRNGTSVNGVAIVRKVLRDGDRVAVGHIELAFHEVEEEAEEQLRTSAGEPGSGRSAGAEVGSLRTTSYLPAPEKSPHDVKAINAWQIVRSFGACERGKEADLVNLVADDLSGLRGVNRVVVYLRAWVLQDRPKWVKAGAMHSRPGVLFSEERIVSVSESGDGCSVCGGRIAGGLKDGDCDAMYVPVALAGKPCGTLYLEGSDNLTSDVAQAAQAAAEAIGIGLTLIRPERQPSAVREERGSYQVALIGRSPALQRCVRIAERAAAVDSTVLLLGESGTGKELFARLVHTEGRRRAGPFVAVHSSAVEEALLGSTLFGHEKGAFTGAIGLKKGLFEDADGGTIFLDEIGELTLPMQVRLLRALQEGEFLRVGGNKPIRVDVRVIAATNRNLETAMRQGIFREDLYFRIKVIEVRIPPLRERAGDVPELVRYFIEELSADLATNVRTVSDEAMEVLTKYRWPGNVRELRNAIERSLVLAEGPELGVHDLPAEIVFEAGNDRPQDGETQAGGASGGKELREVELHHILGVLRECGGNRKMAAERLGISRSTLYERLKKTS